MYDKKLSKTIAICKFAKTKIPVNYLFTGIFCYLSIIPNRLLFHPQIIGQQQPRLPLYLTAMLNELFNQY